MQIERSEHPRPLMVRKDWKIWNGAWDFAFDDTDAGLRQGWQAGFQPTHTIRVPFSYETRASGIGDTTVHPVVWYQKRIEISALAEDETLLLHLEGCDYQTTVFVNGTALATHTGGYERISIDLGPALPCDSVLVVLRVADSLSPEQPRGKQRYRSESWGCWYVQTTGIWKTVWTERVKRCHLASVSVQPLPEQDAVLVRAACTIQAANMRLCATVFAEDVSIAEAEVDFTEDNWQIRLPIPSPRRWRPEDPFLYEVRLTLSVGKETVDTVWSYFGFRTITWQKDGLYLNGKHTFLRMVLDQGYWPDSGLTPPDTDALRTDLDAVARYGYNGVRKHQKIEDDRFFYLCDMRGVLVFSEMAATYADSDAARKALFAEWTEAVLQHMQHPSIVAWVPFNESWGIDGVATDPDVQAFTCRVTAATRSLDPTRPVVSNDGWEHTDSDIVTMHDYRETGAELLENHGDRDAAVLAGARSYSWFGQKLFADGFAYAGQPLLLSEYGGIAFRTDEGWGYGEQVADEAAFLARFLSQNEAISAMPQITGFCYTQLTDVEQEKNGLLNAERKDKLSPTGIATVRASNISFENFGD